VLTWSSRGGKSGCSSENRDRGSSSSPSNTHLDLLRLSYVAGELPAATGANGGIETVILDGGCGDGGVGSAVPAAGGAGGGSGESGHSGGYCRRNLSSTP
jgi:hypothetical protein